MVRYLGFRVWLVEADSPDQTQAGCWCELPGRATDGLVREAYAGHSMDEIQPFYLTLRG